jgi:hypothetical protein
MKEETKDWVYFLFTCGAVFLGAYFAVFASHPYFILGYLSFLGGGIFAMEKFIR